MRVALYLQDLHPIREGMEYARYAEERGFEAVWQAESRLVREATVPMAAYAAVTSRIKVGAGVISIWTRNVGLLAATFSTLDDLAPGRVMLGLGAWWDPLASKVGIDRRKPLRAMRRPSRRPGGSWRWNGSPTTASSSIWTTSRSTSSTATAPQARADLHRRHRHADDGAWPAPSPTVCRPQLHGHPGLQHVALAALAAGARKAGRTLDDIDRPRSHRVLRRRRPGTGPRPVA